MPGGPAGQRRRPNLPLLAQAAYYLVTGLWPLLHFRSFEGLTGPKPDRFVVESTGLLFAATGATLASAAGEDGPEPPVRVLGALVAAASTLAALRHRPQLRAVYLADAAVQVTLAALVWRSTSGVTDRASS